MIAPPHPELTPQQKQHIVDINSAQNQPPKRFGGSVADRVMLFERCPINVNQNESKEIPKMQSSQLQPALNSVTDLKKSNSAPSMPSTTLNMAPLATPVLNNSAAPWKNLQNEGLPKVRNLKKSCCLCVHFELEVSKTILVFKIQTSILIYFYKWPF